MPVNFKTMNEACERAFAAVTFSFTPAAGAPVADLLGDYRSEPVLNDDDGDSKVHSRVPTLGVRLSQLPAGVKFAIEDAITINAPGPGDGNWTIIQADDNAEGMALLTLHKAA